jgi:hypothetical protein
MTLIELSVALTTVTAAFSGALAGAHSGLWAGVAGFALGGVTGMVAAMATVAVTGLVAFALSRRERGAAVGAGGRRGEVAGVLVLAPLLSAPAWAALLAYRLVGYVVGG